MDMFQIAIALGLLAILAHVVKGLTGFGPAIVFVSIGSLIYNPTEIIVLASLLDIIGGGYLSFLNPQFFENKEYWVPIGLLMVTGAVLGSLALSLVPASIFEYFLGVAIVLISLWFISGKSEPDETPEDSYELGIIDGVVGIFSGFCGGFTGMGGPPLVAYLGTKFRKELFRAIVTPVFLVAATAKFSTYGVLGMIDTTNLWLYVFPPIGAVIGNHVGNDFFGQVEQKWFTVMIGTILMLSGIRLLVT